MANAVFKNQKTGTGSGAFCDSPDNSISPILLKKTWIFLLFLNTKMNFGHEVTENNEKTEKCAVNGSPLDEQMKC